MEESIKKNQPRPFGMRDKLSYMAGDLGCNMSFALKGTVTTFWTVFMAMETGLFSFLLILVNIWDAINDPLIGGLIDADKRKYKHGKFKTYIWFGSLGLLVGGALCFLPFPNAPVWAKALLFIAGYVIWDAFYTVANVPYGSMMPLISPDSGDRAQLSAWRSVGSVVGNMIPAILLPFIIYQKTGEIDPVTGNEIQILLGDRVFFAALLMGLIGFVCFLLMLKSTTLRMDENSLKISEDTPKFNVVAGMKKFCQNRAAIGATLAATAMFIGMQGVTTAVNILFLVYFKNAQISGLVSMFSVIPMFIFMPFIRKIVAKWGKQEASVVGSIFGILGGVLLLVFPITPDGAGIVLYCVAMLVYGVGLSIYTAVSWSLMADAIDYNEWKFGSRDEGMIYSLHSFFRKLAQGVGPALILLIMGWIGYDSKLKEAQTFETATNLRWLVAVCYLVSAIVMFVGLTLIYNLNKKKVTEMNAELSKRRAAKAAELEKTAEVAEEAPATEETTAEVLEEIVEETPETIEEAVEDVQATEETEE